MGGLRAIFKKWDLIQEWLLENYFFTSTSLDVELKMEKLRMKYNNLMQKFINRFETLLADLSWNDAAVAAIFRRKLIF